MQKLKNSGEIKWKRCVFSNSDEERATAHLPATTAVAPDRILRPTAPALFECDVTAVLHNHQSRACDWRARGV